MVRQRTLTPSFQGSNPCSPARDFSITEVPFFLYLKAFRRFRVSCFGCLFIRLISSFFLIQTKFHNVFFKKADITNLKCKDERFDKVVAGNVIHLVPNPEKAMAELNRVVKPGGKIIIPTYINMTTKSAGLPD